MTDNAAKSGPAVVLSRRWWVVVVCAIVLLYALNVDSRWHLSRDSAFYLGVGRSIASGEGMTFNGSSYTGTSPALPLLWAGIVGLFGESYLVGRMVMFVFALATIAGGYLLIRDSRGSFAALCGLFVLAGNGRLFTDAAKILTDLPFACLLTWSLLLARRSLAGKRWCAPLAGSALAAAFLFRLVGIVVLPLVLLGMLLDGSCERRLSRRLLCAALVVLVAAPVLAGWFVFYTGAHAPGEGGYFEAAGGQLGASMGVVFSRVAGNLAKLPKHLFGLFIGQRPGWYLSLPFAAVFIVGLVRSIMRREALLLAPALGYVALLILWAPSSISARYLLPIVVVPALWLVDGLRVIIARLLRGAERADVHTGRITLGICGVIVVMGLANPLYKLATRWFDDIPWQVERDNEENLHHLCEWIESHTLQTDKVIAAEHSVINYWTKRRVLFPRPLAEGQTLTPEYRRHVAQTARQADWVIFAISPGRQEEDATDIDVLLRSWHREEGAGLDKVDEKFGYAIYRAWHGSRTMPATSESAPE